MVPSSGFFVVPFFVVVGALVPFFVVVPDFVPFCVAFVEGAGMPKLAVGFGTSTTGGGSGGCVTLGADAAGVPPGGSMFERTTIQAIPAMAATNTTPTNASVRRLREPSSSGGEEIRSLLTTPGAVVAEG
jgi:hypothetical protein